MSLDERTSRLYLRHQTMLMEYIHALVRHQQDAEDILQETGVTILTRAKVPDTDEVFPAWARGVARHTVMHYWRTQRRAKVVPDSRLLAAVDQAFEEADTEPELMTARRGALAECLKQVKGPALAALNLRYRQGFSCEQVAAAVRKTPVAVRVMLLRVRGVLAECIEARLSREGA